MYRVRVAVAVLLVGLSVGGCAGGERGSQEVGSAVGSGPGDALVMVPRYAIGGSDDDGVELSTPAAISVVGDETFVLDRRAASVSVFAREGTRLRAFGSRGQGPGEFQVPTGMAASAERVYVSELGNRRLHAFGAADGQLIYTKEVPVSVYGPMRILADGTLLAAVQTTEMYEDGSARPGVASLSPDGELIDVVLIPDEALPRPTVHVVSGNGSRVTFRPPFEPETVWNISSRGAIALGHGGAYELQVIDRQGGTRTIAGPDHVEPAAVPPGEAAWHAAWSTARIQRTVPDHQWPVEEVAPRKPYFNAVFFDDVDRLWVLRATGARRVEDCDETFPTLQQVRQPIRCWEDELAFDVFAPDGGFVASVEVPREAMLTPSPVVPLIDIVGGVVWVKTSRPDGNEMITGYELVDGG